MLSSRSLCVLAAFAALALAALSAPVRAQCPGNQGNVVFFVESLDPRGLVPGTQARFVILGPPGMRVCFDCDIGDGPVTLPNLGTVCLNLSTNLFAIPLVLPPSGRFEVLFTIQPGTLAALLCCQVAGFDPNAPNNLSLSNGICVQSTSDGKCEGCVTQLGHITALAGAAGSPTSITSTLLDKDGAVLGSTTVAYDPTTQLAFPISDDGVVFIENVVANGGDLYVTSHVSGATLKDGELPKETVLQVQGGGVTQTSPEIHTSCSQPIGVGVVFGPFTVTRLIDCKGNGDPDNVCAGGNKPKRLAFQYTGEDCSASNNQQDPSKATCSGNPAMASPVLIKVTDDSDPFKSNPRTYFDGQVVLGGQLTADVATAGESKFESNTYAHVFDPTGTTVLQTLQFHTSCSQPLLVGNQFGSLLLVGFNQ